MVAARAAATARAASTSPDAPSATRMTYTSRGVPALLRLGRLGRARVRARGTSRCRPAPSRRTVRARGARVALARGATGAGFPYTAVYELGKFAGLQLGLRHRRLPRSVTSTALFLSGMRLKKSYAPPVLAAVAYSVLAISWAVTNPPFAAPDEPAHYLRALAVGDLSLAGSTQVNVPAGLWTPATRPATGSCPSNLLRASIPWSPPTGSERWSPRPDSTRRWRTCFPERWPGSRQTPRAPIVLGASCWSRSRRSSSSSRHCCCGHQRSATSPCSA